MWHPCYYNGWNWVRENKTNSIYVSASMSRCEKCTEHVCNEGILKHKNTFVKKNDSTTVHAYFIYFKCVVLFLICRFMEELQRKILLEKSRKLNMQPDKISRKKRHIMFILYSFLMKQTQPKQSGLLKRSCVIKQSAEDLWTFANL